MRYGAFDTTRREYLIPAGNRLCGREIYINDEKADAIPAMAAGAACDVRVVMG
ncbi:MAG: hypothetical protein FWF69_06555 [Firmicutes bacterium]|nr:hypothetical protein [Bacillota bacterium]